MGSRPARALWIEIPSMVRASRRMSSRPARALWIEIGETVGVYLLRGVEAREGLVD